MVNVYTKRLVTERVAPSLGELFGDFVPRYRQRIERTLGSGVIVDAGGHIVTNHHVIANADTIRVQLATAAWPTPTSSAVIPTPILRC